MIGKIKGMVETIGTDTVLVDVGGIGYIINVSSITKNSLSAVGEEVSLFTEMMVREDSIQLVGFASCMEKDWFRLLISVQGVGAKAALAILGAVPLKQLSRSIISGNPEYIISAPGVGPKIAKRILLELAQKALLMEDNEDLDSKISKLAEYTNIPKEYYYDRPLIGTKEQVFSTIERFEEEGCSYLIAYVPDIVWGDTLNILSELN